MAHATVKLGKDGSSLTLPDGEWREKLEADLNYQCKDCGGKRQIISLTWSRQDERRRPPISFVFRVAHTKGCKSAWTNRSVLVPNSEGVTL